MRAFDVLLTLYRLDMRQGKDYLEAPEKNNLKLKVIGGNVILNKKVVCRNFRPTTFKLFPFWKQPLSVIKH